MTSTFELDQLISYNLTLLLKTEAVRDWLRVFG